MKTPPITFTEDNFCAVLNGAKTETRRLLTNTPFEGIKSKYLIGDRCYLTEPTRIIDHCLDDLSVWVSYEWFNPEKLHHQITQDNRLSLLQRKTGITSKQNARFMLKSFARYHIEITEVKLERLMDITTESAIAEGIKYVDIPSERYPDADSKYYWDYVVGGYCKSAISSYLSEIAHIHKPSKGKIGGWELVDSNPWMWVYKFKLVENHD